MSGTTININANSEITAKTLQESNFLKIFKYLDIYVYTRIGIARLTISNSVNIFWFFFPYNNLLFLEQMVNACYEKHNFVEEQYSIWYSFVILHWRFELDHLDSGELKWPIQSNQILIHVILCLV